MDKIRLYKILCLIAGKYVRDGKLTINVFSLCRKRIDNSFRSFSSSSFRYKMRGGWRSRICKRKGDKNE